MFRDRALSTSVRGVPLPRKQLDDPSEMFAFV